MDDSIRYLEVETLGKVVSGFTGHALNLLGAIREARSEGYLRVRTIARGGVQARTAGAARWSCARFP